ncbi:MAG: hypothetical protein NT166_23335 [Candidatus Aminicenantes bacterium]|nr:hypothetical protein [Candidatus Aminicenantes bacterium]
MSGDQKSKEKLIDIFIATSHEPPSSLYIERKTIEDIVNEVNSEIKENRVLRKCKLVTIVDEKYYLKNIGKLSYEDEVEFHSKIPFCFIDGDSYLPYKKEIWIIRSHHFPLIRHHEVFCILSPLKVFNNREQQKMNIEKHGNVFKFIEENIFRCKKIVPPEVETIKEALIRFVIYRLFIEEHISEIF